MCVNEAYLKYAIIMFCFVCNNVHIFFQGHYLTIALLNKKLDDLIRYNLISYYLIVKTILL